MLFSKGATKHLLWLLYVATSASGLSDECKLENEELANSTVIQNATAVLENATSSFIPYTRAVEILKEEWPDPLPEECFLKDGNQTIVCVFDYTDYVTELSEACESEGGQVFQDEFKVVCQSLGGRRSEKTFLNYTLCFGASCDADNLTDAFEETLEDDIDEAKEEAGYNCILLHKVNSGSPAIIPALLGGVAVVVSSLLATA